MKQEITFAIIFLAVYAVVMGTMFWVARWPSRQGLPDPKAGQIWRCEWNGELMLVSDVRIETTGSIFVTVKNWRDASSWGVKTPHWGMGDHYSIGLDEWRRRLRAERRVLLEAQP